VGGGGGGGEGGGEKNVTKRREETGCDFSIPDSTLNPQARSQNHMTRACF